MRKKIQIVIMFGLIVLSVFIAFLWGEQEEIIPVGAQFPKIKFINLNYSGYLEVKNKPLMIMLFKPDCTHCEYEFDVLNTKYAELNGVDVYCITTDNEFIVNKSYERWDNLSKTDNVYFGSITEQEYKMKIGLDLTPVFIFVNMNGTITDKIIGETKFDRILGSINSAGGAQHQ